MSSESAFSWLSMTPSCICNIELKSRFLHALYWVTEVFSALEQSLSPSIEPITKAVLIPLS